MHELVSTSQHFLRNSLRANAVFSTLSGLSFVIASGAIASFLSGVQPLLVLGTGAQLLVFAAGLVWLASRPRIPAALAIGVIVADLLWVAGTAVAVYADIFSRGGVILLLVLADCVLALAILQAIGLRRMSIAEASAA